ncbi:MAG: hypothetical protein HOW97_39650 [Catenulispora sp.]|nr:hypothetical protein [Catenulispora sp.]NUS29144.1 hypothetical protein [Streptomyces sp.]
MPTATMSQDGTYRIDMRVTFRVSIGNLATYLASALRHVDDLDRLVELMTGLNTRQIRDTVRTEMERRGVDYIDGWADQFSYDETVRRLALAEEHVRRAFPELDKADREQKQAAALAEQIVPVEAPAPATCRHGNAPRPDVTGDPIKACEDGFRAPGHVEYGAFNAEGCFYSGDGCAVDAANAAAEDAEEEDDITWGRMCNDHNGEPADHCRTCNADDAPACTDCEGSGCHWCHWTGRKGH